MAHIEEPLDGGLVTSQDPTTLDPGELTQTRNGFYAPKNKHIQRAPGWQEFVASATSTTSYYTGFAGCYTPHNSSNYLLLQRYDGTLATANAEVVGSIPADIATASSSGVTGLQAVSYNSKWYLMNGVENKVFTASGTGVQVRPHGLFPVDTGFTSTATAASAANVTATGYYDYWYTEAVKYTEEDIVESTYAATKATTVNIASVTACPQFSFPPFRNLIPTGATGFYKLYRSSATKAAATDVAYPDGVFVADVSLGASGTATFIDGGSAVAATANFTTVDSFNHPAWATASGTASTGGASGGLVAGGTDAWFNYKSTWGTALNGGESWGGMFYAPALTVTGNVAGVQLDIKIKSDAPEKFTVKAYIGKRVIGGNSGAHSPYSGPTHGLANLSAKVSLPSGAKGPAMASGGVVQTYGLYPVKSINMTTVSSTYTTATLGGQYDDWLPSDYDWVGSDFAGEFAVLLCINPRGTGSNAPATNNYVAIDGITLSVYQGGKDATVGGIYDVISVDIGGSAVESGSHGRPPTASCGTIFEGSLVTNNMDKPGVIQYSMPGFPDYFPALYQIQLPHGNGSRTITYIGTVNNRLLVATNNALYRVNYLPNEDDASFSRGRAIETVSTVYGVLGHDAACIIITDGGLEELIGASTSGVFGTDGFSTHLVSVDVNWNNGIFNSDNKPTSGSCIALVNTPESKTVRIFLNFFGADNNYSGYWGFSYAPQHRKETGVKWFGPVDVTPLALGRMSAAAVISLLDGSHRLVAAYMDDSNSAAACAYEADTSEVSDTLLNNRGMQLITRIIPLAGHGNEAALHGVYVYGRNGESGGAGAASPDVTLTATQYYANRAANTTYTVSTTAVSNCRTAYVPTGGVNCGGLQLAVAQDDGYNLDLVSLVLVGESFGDEEAF